MYALLYRSSLLLPLLLLMLPQTLPAQGNSEDGYWDRNFGIPGINGTVAAAVVDGDKIFVGGSFTAAGRQAANNVAFWDGNRWRALGGDLYDNGVEGDVYAIAIDGDDVYVGGQFELAGGKPAKNIARWNRVENAWYPVGDGIGGQFFGYVRALALYDGNLYAGGSFTVAGTSIATNIAQWNGTKWSRLGTGADREVYTMKIIDDYLYVGGAFTEIGDISALNLARLNHADGTWSSLGAEFDGIDYDKDGAADTKVISLERDGDLLYIGGTFTSVNDITARFIVQWNSQTDTWTPLGGGVNTEDEEEADVFGRPPREIFVSAILVRPEGLFIGGNFDIAINPRPQGNLADTVWYQRLIRWDGERWYRLPQSIAFFSPTERGWIAGDSADANEAVVHTLLTGPDGRMYAGGYFELIGYETEQPDVNVYSYPIHTRRRPNGLSFAGYDNDRWTAVGSGVNGEVHAITPFGGKLLIGGQFHSIGHQFSRNAGIWNHANDQWELPGDPVELAPQLRPQFDAFTTSTAVDDQWYYAGTRMPGNVTAWSRADGSANDLGTPFGGTAVEALAIWNGRLFAGGAGGLSEYTGDGWTSIGQTDGVVRTIAVHNDLLYVGGDFTTVDGSAARSAAVYDPANDQWSDIGDAFIGGVYAFAFDAGTVWAAGDSIGSDGSHLAAWDGETWEFYPGAPGPLRSLAMMQGELFVGGQFQDVAGDRAPGIARWDGSEWHPLNSGLDHKDSTLTVNALAVMGDTLYVGGLFIRVDSRPGAYFARWSRKPFSSAPEPRTNLASGAATAHPNPFTGEVTIRCTVSESGHVAATMHTVDGRRIAHLLSETLPAGTHQLVWQPEAELPAGPYICRIATASGTSVLLLNLVR